MDTSMRLKAALAGVVATLLTSACALMEPKAERYVAPPVGTTWENMRRDTGSYGAGAVKVASRRGERLWQGEKVLTFEGSEMTILARPTGNWIGFFKGDTPILTWDPALNWEWPLEVGKTWTREQRVTIHAMKRTVPYTLTQKVEAYEDVTVPAGTFKAFKVSTVTSLGDENVVWFSPAHGVFVKQSLRRTAKHGQGPGTREFEMVSYKRAAD